MRLYLAVFLLLSLAAQAQNTAARPAGALSILDFGASPANPAAVNQQKIQSAVDAAIAQHKSLYIPDGVYAMGKVNISGPTHIVCQSQQAILKAAISSTNNNFVFTITSTRGNTIRITTSSFSAGQRALTVAPADEARLQPGADIYLVLGQSYDDKTQPQVAMFNTIAAIHGGDLTLGTPIPEAVAASPRPSELNTFSSIAQNITLSNCGFDVQPGLATFSTIYTSQARSLTLEHLVAKHTTGAFILITDSDKVYLNDIRDEDAEFLNHMPENGHMLHLWGSRNVVAKDLWCQCDNEIITAEADNRGLTVDGAYYASSIKGDGAVIAMGGASSNNIIRNLVINSSVDKNIFANSSPVQISFFNTTIQNGSLAYPLHAATGPLTIKGTTYPAPVTITIPFPIHAANATQTIDLPYGLYQDIRVNVSTKTGLHQVYLLNTASSGGADISPALIADATVDLSAKGFSYLNIIGDDPAYKFNSTSALGPKKLQLYTTTQIPVGAQGAITITYYPDPTHPFANPGSHR